jgi:hypothetical protein
MQAGRLPKKAGCLWWMAVMINLLNSYEPLIMGTIVTPPNANPNLEFADIGTVVAPACSSKMISIG